MHHTTIKSSITFPVLRLQAEDLQRRGGTPALSPATVPGAISDLRSALAWQLVQQGVAEDERHARYLLDPSAGHEAEPIDVRDLLSGTAHAARLRAAAAGGRRPGNAGSRVRRLLEALGQRQPDNAAVQIELPTAWRRVEAILEQRVANESSRTSRQSLQQVLTGLRNLARCATAHGQVDPCALPDTPDGLRAVLRAWERRNVAHDVWVLRSASRVLTDAAVESPTLPSWEADIGAPVAALDAAMPHFMEDLRAWKSVASQSISQREKHRRSPTVHDELRPKTQWRYQYQALQWARAYQEVRRRGLITDLALPEDLTFIELWSLTSRARVRASEQLANSAEIEAMRKKKQVTVGGIENNASRPLAVVVVEFAVAHGVIGGGAGQMPSTAETATMSDATTLPPAAIQMLFAHGSMTERVVIGIYGDGSAAEQTFRMTWNATAKVLKGALAARKDSRQDVGELLKRVTLPQLVCCVLPWRTLVDLPRRQRALRAAVAAAAAPNASTRCKRDVKKARKAFHSALARWVLQATLAADPVRISNAQHARVGAEVLIDAEWSATGELVRIKSISTTFRAHDESDVSETETKQNKERPTWRWSPVIIDHEWAATYVREIWWPAVVERGLVPPNTAMRQAMGMGTIAWFINPTPRSRKAPPVAGANLSKALNDVWADALLEGMRELGRDDIPESTDEARAKWPIVLGPHKIRHLWATYWWGLRGPNGPVRLHRHGVEERTCGQHIARRATGDVDDTLKAHYVMCQSVMLEAARHPIEHFDHPSAYHREMDSTWWLGEKIDWASRWRDKSFPLPASMRQAFLAEQSRQRKGEPLRVRRRREEYVLPNADRSAA
ncbi:MAG: hypothetical protein IBJ19_10655 [Gemmatimonadaceae bacterium]|nr:hypothetical protein [Gemmatimonadaceae bacterium]